MSKAYDIHERIFNYVIDSLMLFNKLPKTSTNVILINQATRSVTSIGANDQEADGAFTNKDFIHGFTLVRKECKETVFWFRVIEKINDKSYSNEVTKLINEGNEIIAIISTIIRKANKK